jgi:hypothetical protein
METEARISLEAVKDAYNIYSDWTDKTAMYPKIHEAHYLALGIAEETGELLNAKNIGAPHDIMAEAGDVFWYGARYSRLVLNIPFSDVMAAARNAQFGSIIRPRYLLTAMGQLCGVEKKRLRDGENWNAAKRSAKHEDARVALLTILAYAQRSVVECGMTVMECIVRNQQKLEARKAADTIKGDGDHR